MKMVMERSTTRKVQEIRTMFWERLQSKWAFTFSWFKCFLFFRVHYYCLIARKKAFLCLSKQATKSPSSFSSWTHTNKRPNSSCCLPKELRMKNFLLLQRLIPIFQIEFDLNNCWTCFFHPFLLVDLRICILIMWLQWRHLIASTIFFWSGEIVPEREVRSQGTISWFWQTTQLQFSSIIFSISDIFTTFLLFYCCYLNGL